MNLQSHSRTQQTIALSSGEAELYAIGAGAADSLFIRSLLLEACLIPRVHLFVHTDSTAGKSMASRRGTSRKTRHVQLRHLFVQELVTSGMITIRMVVGTLNNADIVDQVREQGIFGEARCHFRPKASQLVLPETQQERVSLHQFSKPELVFAVALKKLSFRREAFGRCFCGR